MSSAETTDLKLLLNYAASPNLPSLLQWTPSENGHSVIWKDMQEIFSGVTIVQVFDYKLNCTPNGNFVNTKFGSLDKAKFQFYAGRPTDTLFRNDFSKLFSNLAKLQSEIVLTKQHKDLLYNDPSAKIIRFARSVFEKREEPIPDSPPTVYYQDAIEQNIPTASNVESTIDNETNNWPVDSEFKKDLAAIKSSHRAIPPPVYKDGVFVEPRDVNHALRNTKIEVLFTLHHLHLQKQNPPSDTFHANIEQIIILKSGKTTGSRDPRAGPVPISLKCSFAPSTADEHVPRKKNKTLESLSEGEKRRKEKGKEKEENIEDTEKESTSKAA